MSNDTPGRREFDRIKPPDQRLLERSDGPRLDEASTDPDGRAALFSGAAGSTGGHRASRGAREAGTQRGQMRRETDAALAAHCSRCDATSPLDAGTAVRSALPLFVVLPWRDHPVFALCPACGHRSWLRIGSC